MAAGLLIVTFGNALVGDDGAGWAVADLLERRLEGVPAVRVTYGGTDALRLPSLWRGEPEVWLVDATRSGAAAGTIHRLGHDELLAIPQSHRDAHTLSLPESLRWIALALPEMASVRYRFWGIEVENISRRPELSPAVAAAVTQVAREIAERASSKLP